jgi:hypothetical protein
MLSPLSSPLDGKHHFPEAALGRISTIVTTGQEETVGYVSGKVRLSFVIRPNV